MLEDVESQLRTELIAAGSEDVFWTGVSRAGLPRIEPSGDSRVRVTFLWRDAAKNPFRVYFDASSLTDHHAEDLTVMTQVDDSGIWFWSTEITRTWRGTYCFMPVAEDVVRTLDPPGVAATREGVRTRFLGLLEHAVPDENNIRRFGRESIAEMPDAPVQRWWDDDTTLDSAPRKLRWHSGSLGNSRDVWIHETVGHGVSSERPLVIVLDGRRWIDEAPLAPVLDAAVRDDALPPSVILFVDSGDGDMRSRELPCHRPFWEAVVDELIPLAAHEASFTSDPRRTVVSGQSFGGLASLFAALEFPHRFGLVASQSGSFWWPIMSHRGVRGPLGGRVAEMLTASSDALPIRVVMDVGVHEGDMQAHNHRVATLLRARGVTVDYHEFDGGHETLCWRGGLTSALITLLEQTGDSADEECDDEDHEERDDSEEDDR
ncbi:enterochelin esterase [Rhodococcus sp. Eu-32]|uniref:enterochelin esterase n=1 Tax=Rhodococcus sp. Eu-32 TaxID=1017319 RepID=UPI000DF2F60A|nr:enterochelin esterase [Rhodococcus sp. Eu-32]RRQ25945.1 enterochelin esterase [Rhodococcus sp. Eu-32]